MIHNKIDWLKYAIVFFITVMLFISASYISNYFGNKKIEQLKSIQDKLAINILSSETQFSLLQEMSCKNVSGSVLSEELEELGGKLEWGQKNLGGVEEVSNLRKYYALLQIKDYLLMKRISARCGVKSAFILYFYTTSEHCSECEKQSIALGALRDKYPELRVYSFDFNTDLSAVQAMLSLYKIEDTKLPAVVINDDLMTGFQSISELEELVLASFKLTEKKENASTETNIKQ